MVLCPSYRYEKLKTVLIYDYINFRHNLSNINFIFYLGLHKSCQAKRCCVESYCINSNQLKRFSFEERIRENMFLSLKVIVIDCSFMLEK